MTGTPRNPAHCWRQAICISLVASSCVLVKGFQPQSVLTRTTLSTGTQARHHFRSAHILHETTSVWERIEPTSANEEAKAKPYAEELARLFVEEDYLTNPTELNRYVQYVTMIRMAGPAFLAASIAGLTYPSLSLTIAAIINDSAAFEVISQDASQYIQNILTTCGLLFVLITGNTYYFLYSQQEAIYFALFEEVTVAKSLLEQVALVSQGRKGMYKTLLNCIYRYIQDDLMQIDEEPSVLLSARPVDDPLEDIMYMTSVGEPSIVYQTVRSLRQARAARLGALQRKLPQIHLILLWTLAAIVFSTFPVLGAGAQTIGGFGILKVQACYLSFIVFGITLVLGIIGELRQPAGKGAYNVVTVLAIMVQGLEEELEERMNDKYVSGSFSPTIDVTIPVDFVPILDAEEESTGTVGDKKEVSPEDGLVKRIVKRIRNGGQKKKRS